MALPEPVPLRQGPPNFHESPGPESPRLAQHVREGLVVLIRTDEDKGSALLAIAHCSPPPPPPPPPHWAKKEHVRPGRFIGSMHNVNKHAMPIINVGRMRNSYINLDVGVGM